MKGNRVEVSIGLDLLEIAIVGDLDDASTCHLQTSQVSRVANAPLRMPRPYYCYARHGTKRIRTPPPELVATSRCLKVCRACVLWESPLLIGAWGQLWVQGGRASRMGMRPIVPAGMVYAVSRTAAVIMGDSLMYLVLSVGFWAG